MKEKESEAVLFQRHRVGFDKFDKEEAFSPACGNARFLRYMNKVSGCKDMPFGNHKYFGYCPSKDLRVDDCIVVMCDDYRYRTVREEDLEWFNSENREKTLSLREERGGYGG